VLSNPLHRAIYDQYGVKGLKEGVADGRGGIVRGVSEPPLNPNSARTPFS